ncbi:DUF6056 family protein [Streptomyces jumonjinensis]|uniref:Uncharacterized protein n=1 Tax=Streptomyces jumonjinensis TaxID=1945 RepID=A0A646KKM9_STRJU|nr:DUF6056 family protein [Streptomyces jumonjinensis]MQT02869.1 hypothetical protein [Streptomyces jumonjinensis]
MAADGQGTTAPRQPDGSALPSPGKSPGKGSPGSGRPWPTVGTASLALLPLTLLGAACWWARWVRPSGDDWCFLPVVRDDGLAGMVGKFYVKDNGRIANALLVWVYARFDVAGHQWFAPVSGVLVLAVLWAVTASALDRARLTAPRGVPLLVASMVTAVFLLASPNTYKTFYWPAASVSHTLAPVLACAAAIPLLRARSRSGRTVALAVVFTAGAVVGTLSEETSVVVVVVLSAVLLLSRRAIAAPGRAYARAWCLTGVAGTVIGTLVLVTSPGSRNRRERYAERGPSLFAPESLIDSLGAFARITAHLLTTWQYLGAVAAGVLLGLFATASHGGAASHGAAVFRRTTAPHGASAPRRTIAFRRTTASRRTTAPHGRAALPAGRPVPVRAGVLVFLVAGYLCTVIAYPAFGSGVVNSTRLWNDYVFLYVVLLVGLGALLGHTVRLRERRVGAVRAAGAAVCGIVCVALAFPLAQLGDAIRVRAGEWDHQDRWLRAQAARGVRVLPYRPTPVGGMTEPFGHRGHRSWPAHCVADYYRLERITRSTTPPPR